MNTYTLFLFQDINGYDLLHQYHLGFRRCQVYHVEDTLLSLCS